MIISNRLEIIYSLMEKDNDSVDVGCDHGYLSIKYALNNKNSICYGLDNKIGPLSVASENIKKYKVNNLFVILSDGLDNFDKPFSQLTISGMGGNNIVSILNKAYLEHKLENCENIILQANNNIDNVREYLNRINYKIVEEKIFEESDYIYEVIKFKKGNQNLDYLDIKFGPILRKEKNEIFLKKWIQFSNYLKTVLNQIPDSNQTKKESIQKEIDLINREINL